ncbi:MAG: hypothetical protein U9N39_05450 [Campylobacterota bacterium]|nr:hypothetical protein [Campylobacterota bacterium]
MYKILLPMALLLSGCSHFTINATMCDQIASEPNALMPQECRDYSEKDADQAFNKVVDEKKVSDKDIKFDKEEAE